MKSDKAGDGPTCLLLCVSRGVASLYIPLDRGSNTCSKV